MKHKRLTKIILPFTLCIAIALGNIISAEQNKTCPVKVM